MTFLLSEDKALRQNLQGMTVTDQKADADGIPRQVRVFYGQPDQELREQSYPYITIDMIDVQRDPEREMRGMVKPDYLAPADLAENKDWQIELPIPVNIDYQVTSYARHPYHDRELLSQLLHSNLPFRFGQLSLDDGTYRRLEVMDVSKRDSTEQAKRLYVNAVTVRVSSEISQTSAVELYKVNNVLISDPIVINS